MKVLLIQSNYRNIYSYAGGKSVTPIYPPMGLAYIAAVLRENNIEVKILEANALNLNYNQIKKEIQSYQPTLIGLSSTTCMIEEVNKIANLCKSCSNAKIILGGIHASSSPLETLKEFPVFDIVVIGEGEYIMLEIAQNKPLSKIKGIAYRKNNKIILNSLRSPIENLDDLPFPARDLLPMKNYFSAGSRREPADYILSSRGCPYSCIFCADHLVHGKKFRFRNPENITKEIEQLIKAGVKEFDFIDDNFTMVTERVEKICDLLIAKGYNKNIIWRCSNGVRVDRIPFSLLKKMKQAGCYMLSLGIESGNEQIIKNIKKNINLKQVEKAVKWCNKLGIEARGLYMIGNLGETEATIRDTINFAKKLNTATAVFHITVPFPSTEYHNIIKKEGKLFAKSWKDYIAYEKVIFEHGALTKELMLKMQKQAYKEYYLRPRFILKTLLNINSLKKLKTTINAALTTIKFSLNK